MSYPGVVSSSNSVLPRVLLLDHLGSDGLESGPGENGGNEAEPIVVDQDRCPRPCESGQHGSSIKPQLQPTGTVNGSSINPIKATKQKPAAAIRGKKGVGIPVKRFGNHRNAPKMHTARTKIPKLAISCFRFEGIGELTWVGGGAAEAIQNSVMQRQSQQIPARSSPITGRVARRCLTDEALNNDPFVVVRESEFDPQATWAGS
jgi:hypothetical protein